MNVVSHPSRAISACILASLLLAACTAPMTASPQATPGRLKAALPPALEPATEALNRCVQGQANLALTVELAPPQDLAGIQSDVTLWMGQPPQQVAFAAQLATVSLVVIVHPSNPVKELDGDAAEALFSGRTSSWEAVGGKAGAVHPWVYPPGNEVQAIFAAALPASEPPASEAQVAANPAAMVEGVANDPQAIGYLPQDWLTSRVRPVPLDGISQESMTQPILALTSRKPQGSLLDFLICLQSGAGSRVLQDRYQANPSRSLNR